MKIALDIDDTITALPEFFASLSKSTTVKKCIIVSSRSNNESVRKETVKELSNLGIHYDTLFLIENQEYAQFHCPYKDLDWYSQYLWQKVDICLREKIDIVFEDDEKVIGLFKRFAPHIKLLQIHKN